MKKLLLCLCAIALIACKEEPKDYVTFSGKITDKNSDSILLRTRSFSKIIKVNPDGTFKDTLKVETGMFNFYDGGESTNIYLKNGYDLSMTLDTKMFDETIKFEGSGAKTNNYLAQKSLMEETLYPPSLFDLEEEKFKSSVDEIHNKLSGFLDNNKTIDSTLYNNEEKSLNSFKIEILKAYTGNKEREKARALQFAPYIGKPSPNFENFENYKGGKTSLADLKGKYVYVDLWATWCGPCIREIPSLKEVEKAYHGKKIEFVSISVDNGRGYKDRSAKLAHEGWKKMIADKELGGMQLYADKAWDSDFVKGYKVQGIPRFILIDPNGNVVNADAPRPSSPKLRTLFDSLNI